jgi:hypothetical protein
MREDPADQLAVAQRKVRVVQLRLVGVPFEQIGRQLGITDSAAYKLWKQALRDTVALEVDELRKQEDAQGRQAKAPGITRGLRCGMPGRAGPAQRGAQASP